MDDKTAERLAANEHMFQEVNARLEADVHRVTSPGERIAFVCECSRLSCRDVVELTIEEFRGLRATEERFALVPGHEILEVEKVVERRDGHIVVEKL